MFAASPLGFLAGAVFSMLLLVAAVEDVRSRRIPNVLVAPLALLGLAYSGLMPPSLGGALRGVEGLMTGLVCWLPFYAFGWLGAGEVKMFAAAGAWLGPMRAVEGTFIAALLGAVVALLWMLRTRGVKDSFDTLGIATTLPVVLAETASSNTKARSIPYGVPMAAGALLAGWMPKLLF
jgi:prepilin peptidase CpaA